MSITRKLLVDMREKKWIHYKQKKDECEAAVKLIRDQFYYDNHLEDEQIERLDMAIDYIDYNDDEPLAAFLRAK